MAITMDEKYKNFQLSKVSNLAVAQLLRLTHVCIRMSYCLC